MNNQGVVVEVNEDTVVVRMARSSACGRCNACEMFGKNEMLVTAKNPMAAKLNDNVKITMTENKFWQALGVLYGLPFAAAVAGLFAGAYLGEFLGFAEYSALLGLALGAFGVLVTYRIIKSREPKRDSKICAVAEMI